MKRKSAIVATIVKLNAVRIYSENNQIAILAYLTT